MALTAVEAARDYVEDAIRRHVVAISPRTISSRLGCNDEQAVAILKSLREQGYGVFHGYVHCPACNETVPLSATVLIDMIKEAGELVNSSCRFCGNMIAADRDELEVQLSFFLKAVAGPKATAGSTDETISTDNIPLSLRLLEAADRANPQQIVLVQSGGVVTMHGHQNIENSSKQADHVAARVDVAAKLDISGDRQGTSESSAKGKEIYRHRKSRSKLLAFFLGHSEEEREREGQYSESNSKSFHWTVRLGIILAVVGVITVAVVVLVKMLRH